nr:DegT/DnrJ/EryC1/StrS family aminotransferase [uncultured Eisenbergiella sp.]
MEFRDLKQQYQFHKKAIDAAIMRVVEGANFIGGGYVRQLEQALSEYVGVRHCVTCANGTDALQLALMTWGIGKGDAVFVPDFTFFSSGEVVPHVGATPIFIDVESDTYNISADSLEKAVEYVLDHTELKPRVIVAVDLFGQPADYAKIRKVANRYGMYILEDGAQGFGGGINKKKACSFGDISTTSFFPAKPLGCYGDGGALFTDNDEWADTLYSLCVHGKGRDKYENEHIGMNSRLDALQASLLIEKLKFFDEEINLCAKLSQEYNMRLKNRVKLPVIKKGMQSSWAQYTICFENVEQREKAIENLKKRGIPNAIYYKKPMHEQKAFKPWKIDMLDYAVTMQLCKTCLSLPMHAYLNINDIDEICLLV